MLKKQNTLVRKLNYFQQSDASPVISTLYCSLFPLLLAEMTPTQHVSRQTQQPISILFSTVCTEHMAQGLWRIISLKNYDLFCSNWFCPLGYCKGMHYPFLCICNHMRNVTLYPCSKTWIKQGSQTGYHNMLQGKSLYPNLCTLRKHLWLTPYWHVLYSNSLTY